MSLPDDKDKTVIKSTSATSSSAPVAWDEHADALPVGTRLHEFEILSVIGQGGFGIVYLAHDQSLDRQVAIKEYMPSSMAVRHSDLTVAVRSSRDKDTFAAGLRSFINEARLLARFDHASLLKVHQFWETQGTAYMVMPFYAGITFGHQLKQRGKEGHRPDESQLRALLMPLLDALAQMHAANCFHRDIAPDNILILTDEQPLLLDFGAARHVIADMTAAPTVILKNGYAPVEQYGEMPDMRQGAWTDLYALGAVMQYAITGRTPPQAVARFLQDKREPLAVTAAGQYSDAFLRAIDRSLAVLPQDRPQSAAEMRALLVAAAEQAPSTLIAKPAGAVAMAPAAASRDVSPQLQSQSHSHSHSHSSMPVSAPLQPATKAPRHGGAEPQPTPGEKPATATGTAVERASGPPTALLMGLLLLVLLALIAWAVMQLLGKWRAPQDAPAPAPIAAESVMPEVREKPLAPAAPVAVSPTPDTGKVAAPTVPTTPASMPTPAATQEPPDSASVVPPKPEGRRATPGPAARPPVLDPAQAPLAEQARPAPVTPKLKLRHPRCEDIIARVSLGEELGASDKAILARECK